jgi:hypothetical protein
MNHNNQPQTLLSLCQIAQRWDVHRDTARKYVEAGRLAPAFGKGKAARYPLAQVLGIEAADSIHPINLQPFPPDQRTNPARVRDQITAAADALAAFHQMDGVADLAPVRVALARLMAVLEGGDAGGLVQPAYPAPMYVGAFLSDPEAAQVLANMAQAGLARLTCNGETMAMLAGDMGPATRARIEAEVQRVRQALR